MNRNIVGAVRVLVLPFLAAVGVIVGVAAAQPGGAPPPTPVCVITDDKYACDGFSLNGCPVIPIESPSCPNIHPRNCNNSADHAAVGNQATTPSNATCRYYKQK